MKRTVSVSRLSIALLIALLFSAAIGVWAFGSHADPAAADEAAFDYAVEAWEEFPQNDFVKNDKGNTTEQVTEYLPGSKELRLTGGGGSVTSPTGSAYLSSIYLINPSVTDYTDFTFTITFRATHWLNDSRWFGIMYRMQTDADGLPGGYIFTNRMNTVSAYTANVGKVISGVTGNDNGFKDTNHSVAKNAYTDRKYHTATVTMQGNTAKHYVDGVLVGTAVTTDKDEIVGGHDSGGFALLVSQCSINVKSCTIQRSVVEPQPSAPQDVPTAGEYEVTDFSNIASGDWAVSTQSDYANTTRTVNDKGELVLTAVNPDNTLYYGGLFTVNAGAVYGDFTFEIEFKITPRSWINADRWLGVVYHTDTSATARVGTTAGYIMQYRVSGKNAYSAVNHNKEFNDSQIIEAGGALADGTTVAPVLGDGAYHKITVVMTGNTAKHYMDGLLIREAATADKAAHLGATYEKGGFSLIVNSMELNIKSCKITPTATDDVTGVTPCDNTVVSAYQDPDVKIVNAPAVVADVTDDGGLMAISAAKKPTNAILHIDGDCNVIGADGGILGTFDNIYKTIQHSIIPVVYVDGEASANALISYLTDTLDILDLAVMSDDPALVKKVRTACPRIRGIVEYSADAPYTDGKLDLYNNIVGVTNASYANVAVIPQSVATQDNVRYIQARFKTVWVRADGDKKSDFYASVNSGAYGVITGNVSAAYSALESYPANSYTRMSFNVAHRGSFAATDVPTAYPTENSLGAINEAIALGASHLEIDVHLTKDERIVVMHDTTINRTAAVPQEDGTLNIGDYTLEQIQKYKLKDGQHIPVLEEVFAVLERHKDVVLVLELKAGKTIVDRINALMGTGDGQYDVRDQVVIITFNNSGDDLLTDIKNVMPTTPAAFLLTGNNTGTLVYDLAATGHYNCGLDMGYNDNVHKNDFNKYLTDRGISNWYWTFNTMFSVIEQVELGHVGITNNAAGVLMTMPQSVIGEQGQRTETLKAGDKINARVRTYGGEAFAAEADVFYCEKTDNYWTVVVSYTFTDGNGQKLRIYSPSFIVGDMTYEPDPTEPEKPDDPSTPTEPEEPTDPSTPTEPENPNDPSTPTEPENPNDPNTPTEPSMPTEPNKPDTKPNDTDNKAESVEPSGNGMSGGAVAGLAVGVAVAAAAIGVGCTLLIIKKKKSK